MKELSNQFGFTLMELMFASVLSVVVIGAFFAAIRAHDAQWDEMYIRMNLEEQGTRALQKMEHELRMSAPSRITQSDGTAMTDGTTYTAIKFQVPNTSDPVNTSTYAVNWTGAHTVTYSVSGAQLIRTDATAATDTITRKLSNFITSASFVPANSKSTVAITLNLQGTTRWNRAISQTVKANVEIRNP